MAHPGREVRVRRHIALLELYDRMRAGEAVSPLDVSGELGINRADATTLWKRIYIERLGIPPPARPRRDVPLPVEMRGPAPEPPPGLTTMEKAIHQVLGEARRVLSAADIYAAATQTPVEYATRESVVVHVASMRRKGCEIATVRGVGYWLVREPAKGEVTA